MKEQVGCVIFYQSHISKPLQATQYATDSDRPIITFCRFRLEISG